MSSGNEIVAVRGAGTVAGPGFGHLVVSRVPGAYRDLLRRYEVMIDDVHAGSIGRGRTLIFEVPAGRHRLRLRIAWCSSNEVNAMVEPGGTASFVCAPGDAEAGALAAISTHADAYISLEPTPEPIFFPKTRLDRHTRAFLGAGIGFFGGGLVLIGALIWPATGVAHDVVIGASMAVTVASMVAARFLLRRRAARP